jgi:hypothetical protein
MKTSIELWANTRSKKTAPFSPCLMKQQGIHWHKIALKQNGFIQPKGLSGEIAFGLACPVDAF